MISVVVPVYGCQTCLYELCRRVDQTMKSIPSNYEILLINDCSPDQSWETIQKISKEDHHVRGFDMSRNFGQHRAITAGLDHTKGDFIVVMDCDLQDQPEEIKKLYEKALEGYEVVFGTRVVRQDGILKRLSSKLFYKVYDYLTDRSSDHTIANFSICSRNVIDNYRNMREQNRFFPLFIKWMGFKTTSIPVDHGKRLEGKSSYNVKKMVRLATDVIISQSNKPLRLSIQFGFLISFVSFIYGIYLILRYFFLSQPVPGWTSVMVSLYFIGGLIFFNFGVLGLYLGKVFNETKGRPLYIIRDVTDKKKDEVIG
ncbi:glycosyltransferase family 2 protein [Halobacillus shinanisalinarum]|uniref:Glycosyltransferase family 2 protein n=1 Tax=Halobacillus shinanisalinarum TaxID=2932258 RepID=A0ABY4GYG8_9BACI|nr:glycosyltransferase family 2 protein [Halobacillus shinanisalinarum]UOQ92970.1 glycosyltransferase family 2 protein [Halobacillus shinanisalinarum]